MGRMQVAQNITPFNVDEMVSVFLKDNKDDLQVMCNKHYPDNKVALAAFEDLIKPQLHNACITFINNGYQQNYLKPYFISVILNFIKNEKREKSDSKKIQTLYVCPACKYLDVETIITFSKVFRCHACVERFKTSTDPKEIKLLRTFMVHGKKGYKCSGCDRFIPHPLDKSENVTCPYYDCCFSGIFATLKIMRHPITSIKTETISFDAVSKGTTNSSLKDKIASSTLSSESELLLKEEFEDNLDTLKDVIQSQINSLYYNSTDSTLMHKLCMYQAYLNLINKYPEDMVSYLVMMTRHGGLQHKIFQEYVSILEKKIPFIFKKNGKLYRVTSLLDEELNVFEGISVFDAEVTSKKEIKNATKEFYIGGRKGSYSKPYYMGKLLDVLDVASGKSILSDVKSYSFSRIKLETTLPEKKVRVSHLRVPPHYQMGGMVHLNRIRRKIVDKVYATIHGHKRDVKNDQVLAKQSEEA